MLTFFLFIGLFLLGLYLPSEIPVDENGEEILDGKVPPPPPCTDQHEWNRVDGVLKCSKCLRSVGNKGASMAEHPKKGNKFDNDKPDLSLIPREPLWELARVLMAGEKKYGRWNWQGGIDTHRLTAAAMRHITQFNDGELIDKETGTSHLLNACANLFFAFWMLKNKPEHHTIPHKNNE